MIREIQVNPKNKVFGYIKIFLILKESNKSKSIFMINLKSASSLICNCMPIKDFAVNSANSPEDQEDQESLHLPKT